MLNKDQADQPVKSPDGGPVTPAPTPVMISHPPPRPKRDRIDVALTIIQAVGGVALTGLVTVAGYFFTVHGGRITAETSVDVAKATGEAALAVKREDSRTKILDVALGILKSPPKGNSQDQFIRAWAVDVVTQYFSEVKVDQDTKAQLVQNAIPTVSPSQIVPAAGPQPGPSPK